VDDAWVATISISIGSEVREIGHSDEFTG